MSLASFVAQYLPQAQTASAATGLPVDFILAQGALESGSGTSNAAVNGNNFFGISPGGALATYPTPDAGFSAYSSLINANYSGASAFASSGPLAIGNYLNANGYSTTPDYANRVAGLVPQVDSALSDIGASTGVQTGASGSDTSNSTSSSGSCGLSPGCWLNALGSWLGNYLTAGAFVVVAIVLIIGAVYLFGKRETAP